MAQNNTQAMIFEIRGDESGLQRSLKNAANSIGDFSNRAGGSFSGITTGLSQTQIAVSSLAGAVGVAGIAIAATMAKVSAQSEKAFEIFQAGSLSQMGITQLQQMANMYAAVGLTIENVADQQKDLKDRLGDALTNGAGSMLTDVIQPLKLNVLELQKMADAGEDVYAKIYFAAKAQGLSTSQLVNMFETMGSDAAKRLTVLQQYNSEQEYNNRLSTQQVQLTEEQSAAFEKYRASTATLSIAWEKWNNSAIAPIASNLADILNLMTRILNSKPVAAAAAATGQQGIDLVKQYQKDADQNLLKNSSIYGWQLAQQNEKDTKQLTNNLSFAVGLAQANLDNLKSTITEYNKGVEKSTITASMKTFQTAKQSTQASIDALDVQYKQTKEAIEKSLLKAYGGNSKAMQADIDTLTEGYKKKREDLVKSLTASEDKEAEAAKKKAEAAAQKAAAAQRQADAKRIQAQKVLQQTLTAIAGSGAQVQVQQFNEQQDAIETRIRDSAKTLGTSEAEVTEMLKGQYESRTRMFKEMVESMLNESDPKKLAQNIAAIGGNNISGTQLTDIQNSQDERLGIDSTDPFQMTAGQSTLDKINTDGQAELALNQQLYEAKLLGYQQYQDRMAAINDATSNKIAQANTDAANKTLTMYATGAQDLGTMMAGAFGESNAAAVASFAISKGVAVAQSMINIQQGVSEAMKLGWPLGIPAGLKVAAEGAKIMSTIKNTKIQGQAHDGWDSLPSTGTYNLEKGERVVGKSLNQDLTKYLSSQGSSGSGDIKIEAPLIIQNAGELSDSKFQAMCDKHADTLVQVIRKSQKKNV
ncbi:hypothetical protein [Pseudescherichia sp.]|uniref:hypothetical protein n=1 Tax=Pseudescherichia sp. TaxID=2055881 RepID=UPI00289B62D2|nr:hypothetical protein [Pseudescherichia sp.]WPO94207.1 hypothetical protein SFA32_14685 [Buttiauxella sp. HR94]